MNDTTTDHLQLVDTGNLIPIRPRKRFFAITGGKGGVGKSTIALNLAVTYGQKGHAVGAIDADFGMADLNLLLGVAPRHSVLDVLEGAALEDVMIEAHGINLLPGLNGSHRLANADRPTHQRIMEVVGQLRQRFDSVVIDCPAGIEKNSLAVTAMAEEVLVVATPEPLSLADAYATLKVLSRMHGLERAFLVPNQVRSDEQGKELAEQLKALVDHFLGIELLVLPSIPFDSRIPSGAASGTPIVLQRPDAKVSRAISRLARAIDAHTTEIR